MIPNQQMKSETNIKLPIFFIVYALLAFVTSQIILFLNSSELLIGQFRMPDIWASAHFLLLGFAVMVSMGAMYQLVPVAFLTPIWNETFGFIQFFITAIGFALLSILLGVKPDIAVYGGIITVLGVFMFIMQMILTISKQTQKNTMTYFVISAIICFLFTIIAGFLLVWNFAFGGILNHDSILFTHISLGVAGWFSMLIFGFSYKLVPMFSLSHGFSMKWAKSTLISYIIGLLLLLSSFWLQIPFLQTVSWFILLVGFILFVLDMAEIIRKRVKKKLDRPFIFSLFAIGNGLVIHMTAFVASVIGVKHPTFWSWLVFLYILTWIIFSILGYLYKIVPFLWWTHKYSGKIGKEKVPTLKEMINEKLSVCLFISFTVSIIGILFGASLQLGWMLFIFLGILTVTTFVYALSIFHVLLK